MKGVTCFFLFLFIAGGKQQVCSQSTSLKLVDKFRIPTTNEILKGSVRSVKEICYIIVEDTSKSPAKIKKYEYIRARYKFSNIGHLTLWKQNSWGKREMKFTSNDASYCKIDSVKGSLREEKSAYKKNGKDTEGTTYVYLNGSLQSTIFKKFNSSQQLVYLREEESVNGLGVYERRFTYKDSLLSEAITSFDGSLFSRICYFYSNNGLLDSCHVYDERGLDRRIVYTYNLEGDEIRRQFSSGRVMNASLTEYTSHDHFGNWTKMTSPAGIDSYYCYVRKITYY